MSKTIIHNTSTHSALRPPVLVDDGASGVKCNGGSGVLGHPEVYYSFDNQPEVTCSYCGQTFLCKD